MNGAAVGRQAGCETPLTSQEPKLLKRKRPTHVLPGVIAVTAAPYRKTKPPV